MARLHLAHIIVVSSHTFTVIIHTLDSAGAVGYWVGNPGPYDYPSRINSWVFAGPRYGRVTTMVVKCIILLMDTFFLCRACKTRYATVDVSLEDLFSSEVLFLVS